MNSTGYYVWTPLTPLIYRIPFYISVPGLAINLLGLYTVATKSPCEMQLLSRHILIYLGYSTISDITLSTLCAPLVFYNPFAFVFTGLLAYIDVPATTQLIGYLSLKSAQSMVVAQLFVGLMQAIMPQSHPLKLPNKVTTGILIFLWVLEEGNTLAETLQQAQGFTSTPTNLPELGPYLDNPSQVLMISDQAAAAASASAINIKTIMTAVQWLIILSSITIAAHTLFSRRGFLSEKTMKMQKKWIIGVAVQAALPVFTDFLPLLNTMMRLVNKGEDTVFVGKTYDELYGLGAIGYCLTSVRGLLCTLLTLSVYKPYREYIKKMARKILLGRNIHRQISEITDY